MVRRLAILALLPLGSLALAQSQPQPAPAAPPPPLDPAQALAAFAPGEGREVTATTCGACHSPVIITSKKLDGQGWAQIVDQMIDKGAQVQDQDYNTIVTYLAKSYGP
ncbi:hypothetical protein [Sphingobium sp.]|uniref:hypothetical protein n=1 Tax=Sphingobium sp. TaxID=1912891 RepID=UPI0028BDB9CF|nr:hypothetical protein [Sphingobium sp.]